MQLDYLAMESCIALLTARSPDIRTYRPVALQHSIVNVTSEKNFTRARIPSDLTLGASIMTISNS